MSNKNQTQSEALLAQLNAATDQESTKAIALLAITAVGTSDNKLAAALAKIAQQDAELDDAAKLNQELQQQVEIIKAGGKILPSFKLAKDTYEVLHGVNLDARVLSAEDIAGDVKVQKQLVASQSGAIRKVEAEVTE